jgi:peroxiredoxin
MPDLALAGTDGREVRLDRLGDGITVVFVYPQIGVPGSVPELEWDAIPGARGCTPEACGFRDHQHDLRELGVSVIGVSSQDLSEQRDAVERHGLGYPLASDPGFELSRALGLPTFEAGGRTYYRRLTMVVRDGAIEHVFYPVFPPDRHAAEVVDRLSGHG